MQIISSVSKAAEATPSSGGVVFKSTEPSENFLLRTGSEPEDFALSDGSVTPVHRADAHIDTGQNFLLLFPDDAPGMKSSAVHAARLDSEPDRGPCEQCGFYVRLTGHEARCRPRIDLPAYVSKLGWVGSSAWETFLRATVVVKGLRQEEVTSFLSNQFFSEYYGLAKSYVVLGDLTYIGESIYAKATYTKAVLAVSAVFRVEMASKVGGLFAEYSTMLWRNVMVISSLSGAAFSVTPNLDGYCYLDLFPEREWHNHVNFLRPYPLWQNVKSLLAGKNYCGTVYFKVLGHNCHVSKTHFPGALVYTGNFYKLPLSTIQGITIGSERSVCLTTWIRGRELHSSWPGYVHDSYAQLEQLIQTFARDQMFAVTRPEVFRELEPLFHKANVTRTVLALRTFEFVKSDAFAAASKYHVERPFQVECDRIAFVRDDCGLYDLVVLDTDSLYCHVTWPTPIVKKLRATLMAAELLRAEGWMVSSVSSYSYLLGLLKDEYTVKDEVIAYILLDLALELILQVRFSLRFSTLIGFEQSDFMFSKIDRNY